MVSRKSDALEIIERIKETTVQLKRVKLDTEDDESEIRYLLELIEFDLVMLESLQNSQ